MAEAGKEMSLAYLQGKVEALEAVIIQLIGSMPNLILADIDRTVAWKAKDIAASRDADPSHQLYDMQTRSHYPPSEMPFVTAHAAGALDVFEPIHDRLDELLYERREGSYFSPLAITPEAAEKEKDLFDG